MVLPQIGLIYLRMKKGHRWVSLIAAAVIATAGCSHKEQAASSAATASSEAASSATAAGVAATAGPASFVSFQFTDVAIATTTPPVLRLGFNVKNGGKDPLLCEESEFSLQLPDATTLAPDAGAENRCDPDMIDPGSTGKAVMFFDLKSGYSGPVTLVMSENTTIVGRGTTQVH